MEKNDTLIEIKNQWILDSRNTYQLIDLMNVWIQWMK